MEVIKRKEEKGVLVGEEGKRRKNNKRREGVNNGRQEKLNKY